MWVLATRSRVSNCKRFIKEWHNTKSNSKVYVRLDECDPDLTEMRSLPWPDTFMVTVGPRCRIGEAMQEMFAKFPNEPFYGMLADDLIPKTEFWDQLLIDAAGSNRISHANDIHESEIRICHPCVGGDLVRFVGFFGLPVVKHFGTDTFWEEVHHKCRMNNKLRDVILEHAHFNFGQAVKDKTYEESQALKKTDRAAYRAWTAENLDNTIERIKSHFNWV
jgi:hypothetical protein